MQLSLIGINHKTAPVEIRERVALSADVEIALARLREFVTHGVILSTCNRTEIYATGNGSPEGLTNFLGAQLRLATESLNQYLYRASDERAIEHIFRTASGLDSMVIGEFEILGQVGSALDAAEKAGMINLALRQLFRNAVRTGRRVREETSISRNAVSVSSVAIDLIQSVCGNLSESKMIVIGAGEAGRLVAKVAKERGMRHLFVTSRTRDRAAEVATELEGTAISLLDLVDEMADADIVVACTNAPHWIIDTDQIGRALESRGTRPLLMMDISVPRNIEPAVAGLPNVVLYDIDDLNRISEANRQGREYEMARVEEIAGEETAKFAEWWKTLRYRPVVTSLMGKAESIRRQHLDKTLRKLRPLSAEEIEDLESMTKAIVTKILHDPIECLKGARDDANYAEVVSEIFQLDTREQRR